MKIRLLFWTIALFLLIVPSVSAGVQNNIWNNLSIYWTSDTNTTWNNATNGIGQGANVNSPTFKATDKMVGSGATEFGNTDLDVVTFDGSKLTGLINFTAGCWVNNTEDTLIEPIFARYVSPNNR